MNQRMDSRQADIETKISSTRNSNGKRERTDDSAPVRAEAHCIAAEKEATLEKHRVVGEDNLWCEGCEKICNSTDLCFEEYTTTGGDKYPAVYLCEACFDSDIVNISCCGCLTRDDESLTNICSSQKGSGLICDKCAAADSSDTAAQQPATVVQQPAVQQPATSGYTQFHNPILMMMKMAAEGTNIDASRL